MHIIYSDTQNTKTNLSTVKWAQLLLGKSQKTAALNVEKERKGKEQYLYSAFLH